MRSLLFILSFTALSACVTGEEAPQSSESTAQGEVAKSACEDAWECWCNTFSTRTSCTNAVQGNRHCWWEGPSAATSALEVKTASLGVCHATYE